MTVVVKLGGNAIGAGLPAIAPDLAHIPRLVVVHGGGPQTTALQQALGQTPRKVAGRRITDEAALDALKMAVGGKINIDLCAGLVRAGARPIGLHGASACVILAARRPPSKYAGSDALVDLGLVGDVIGVDCRLLEQLMDLGHVPVLACIGCSREGVVYNINADVVANRVAAELRAESLVMVSDIRSVRRDKDDATTRIARITAAEAQQLIDDGIVTEGMIPKLEEACAAIAAGVGRVHITGELTPGELARELHDPGSIGTAIVP